MKNYSVREMEAGMVLDDFDTLEEVKEFMIENVNDDIINSNFGMYFWGDWQDNYGLYDNELDDYINFVDEIENAIKEVEKKHNVTIKRRYGIREEKEEEVVFESFDTLEEVKKYIMNNQSEHYEIYDTKCYEIYDTKNNKYIGLNDILD